MEHNKGFEKAQREYEAQEDPRLIAEDACGHNGDDDCLLDSKGNPECENCQYSLEELNQMEEDNRADYDYERQKCREEW